MQFSDLPALNATLNAISAILLLLAFRAIRRNNERLHRNLIMSAVAVSVVFLTSYVIYHYSHGSTEFEHGGALRVLYFSILIPHTILAASLVPLVVVTMRLALTGQRQRHRRLARFTWPIWMFVSVTGVVIYLMLYQI